MSTGDMKAENVGMDSSWKKGSWHSEQLPTPLPPKVVVVVVVVLTVLTVVVVVVLTVLTVLVVVVVVVIARLQANIMCPSARILSLSGGGTPCQ